MQKRPMAFLSNINIPAFINQIYVHRNHKIKYFKS